MTLAVLAKPDFKPRTADAAGRHFASKVALTSTAFDTLSNEAKGHAVRIAGVHKARLIQRARDAVHRGIRDGTPWPKLRAELLELFDTEGVPPPALSKLRFTFQQNAMQAYNDGRREMLDDPDVQQMFPYRMYLTVGNGTAGVRGVRPEHAALHRLVLKADDPFWDHHTPPWGYGCRCTFVALTRAQARKLGVAVRDLNYVRKRIRVPGQRKRGIAADPRFVRGGFDLAAIDRELRRAVERMIGKPGGDKGTKGQRD